MLDLEKPVTTSAPPTPLLPAATAYTIAPADAVDVVQVVAAWHDDTHPDPWVVCDQQPCDAIRRINGPDRVYNFAVPACEHTVEDFL